MDEEDIHIYNGILLSHKKDECLPFATTWIEPEGIRLSEISQTEKDEYHRISPLHGIFKKKKRKQNKHNHREQTSDYKGKGGGEGQNG